MVIIFFELEHRNSQQRLEVGSIGLAILRCFNSNYRFAYFYLLFVE